MNPSERLALCGGAPLTGAPPAQWPQFDESDIAAVVEHMREEEWSAYEVTEGPLLDFERELAEFFDVDHALLVSSGTAALQSALFGAGIGPGDEVVAPAIGYQGTGSVALHAGANVRLCDVDPSTGNPTVESLGAAMSPDVKCVILAHAWGSPADIEPIKSFLDQRGVKLIEDAARACGSQYLGKSVGSFGAAGCISFHELKAIPAGEGGVLLTSDRAVYENAVVLGHYFRSKDSYHITLPELQKYRASSLGLNLKIHPFAAALARHQMQRLPRRLLDMESSFERFAAQIADLRKFSIMPTNPQATRLSRYGFNVLFDGWSEPGAPSLATLVAAIKAEGVKVSTIGGAPLFQLGLYRDRGHPNIAGRIVGPTDDEHFPGSLEHAAKVLRFPTLYCDDSESADRYASVLRKLEANWSALADWEVELSA
ncbi:MAG: aminotransferase class I/II-fold pyridoxal phosphate-dependent enzyme [Erythrobacter sp.]|nr:aminotransferase class I/II-fold pyridoxal phosphate-dependent enzyme [Erythrobacter sp.]